MTAIPDPDDVPRLPQSIFNMEKQPQLKTMVVELWICPGCFNYYGSSSAGDLTTKWNTDEKNRPTFLRSQCPSCESPRVLHRVEVQVKEVTDARSNTPGPAVL